MKLSKIQQIIKEEVAKAVSEIDKNRELNDKFAAAVGFTPPAPGGPENRMRTKEYTFEYVFERGEDDYDVDIITVEASSEEEARDKAYSEAKKEHRFIRTSKEKFELLSDK